MLLIRKKGDAAWHAPQVTAYSDEQALQTLIAQSPDLLPGTAGQEMAVVTELAVPLIGYVDVVGVDPEGNITLVECKLKANPEIRRQIVGQVLAYAAGLWTLSYEAFDQAFAARYGAPLAQAVAALKTEGWDEEAFRTAVADNLARGRFRLVIAIDEITDELKRIVLYLNQHTVADLQMLALELGYVADEGVEVLVPNVYGEESNQSKTGGASRRWDKQSVFAALAEYGSPMGVQVAQRLYGFANDRGATFYYNDGPWPAVTAQFLLGGKQVSAFGIYPYAGGKSSLAINFEYLLRYFSPQALSQLADRLRTIPGVAARYAHLEQAGFRKRPSLSIDQILTQPGAVETVEDAIDDLLQSAPQA